MKKTSRPAITRPLNFKEFSEHTIKIIEADFGVGYLDSKPALYFAMLEQYIKVHAQHDAEVETSKIIH
jgi:hypothetical protein